MARFLNREELAAQLEISPARVQQLTGQGILERKKNGYDVVAAAIALARYVRRDEEQKAARVRLITAAAAISERRQRQVLRQLVTLGEVRATLSGAFGDLHGALQAGSSIMFAELKQEIGDDKARSLTGVVYAEVLAMLIQYRDAARRACERLEAGLHEGDRLDRVVDELREAVGS